MTAGRREFLSWLLTTVVLVGVYLLWPGLDLLVSRQFYLPDEGFWINRLDAVQAVHHAVPLLGRVLFVLAAVCWALGRWGRWPLLRRWWRPAAALTLCMVFGLGALVHEVFKDHWGRARPVHIEAFGGQARFTPPLQPSDQCDRNCSFVSGHAATGFVLVAVGALGAVGRRRRWLWVGTLAGLTLGVLRIAQGGHFLSDVLFGWLMMWGVAMLIRDAWVRARTLKQRKHWLARQKARN
jgi:lipid A 4'-phosphatase